MTADSRRRLLWRMIRKWGLNEGQAMLAGWLLDAGSLLDAARFVRFCARPK